MKVHYRCKHLTCRQPCYEGELEIANEHFDRLRSITIEANDFKSPNRACRLGFTQDFEIVALDGEVLRSISAKRLEKEIMELENRLLALREEHRGAEVELDQIIRQKKEALRRRPK